MEDRRVDEDFDFESLLDDTEDSEEYEDDEEYEGDEEYGEDYDEDDEGYDEDDDSDEDYDDSNEEDDDSSDDLIANWGNPDTFGEEFTSDTATESSGDDFTGTFEDASVPDGQETEFGDTGTEFDGIFEDAEVPDNSEEAFEDAEVPNATEELEGSFEDVEVPNTEFSGSFEDAEVPNTEFTTSFEDAEVPDTSEFGSEWGTAFNQEDNSGVFGDTNTLSLDTDNNTEDTEADYDDNVLAKAKRGKEAKAAYDATFDGVEQLEHSLFSLKSKLRLTTQVIPLKDLIPSEFKKQSREHTIIGLNGIVSQWGVVNPVHVMKLEDGNAYLILDGLRRVYAAMKNGFEEVECRVWDFENTVDGKKLVNIISLMINRSERYKPNEQWAMMKTLERTNDLTPGLLEFLLQLEAGQAVKLRDIMQCEAEYQDIREKLIMGELDIEGAYKKLNAERKKENRLQKEDMTSIENTVDESRMADKDKRRLSDEEVHDLLDMTNADVSGEDLSEMDMTNEIRGNDKYQTTDERHPVDSAVKQATFVRDNFHCRCCGIGGVQWLGILIFHHAVPVYAGGPDTVENGLTLCQNCHMTLHNYIMGKVQVDYEALSDSQKKVFHNIFKYGNIALEATKRRGLKKEDIAKLDKTGVTHAYPDANIKENTLLFTQAATQKPADDSDGEEDTSFAEGNDITANED